jgi:light-independent protochlorophyllide reductase subunit B
VHVQDFPARYSPQMGIEGANVIFDTLIHPLVMGLEEHLLTMFREDFEFHDDAGPSHHGHKAKLREVGINEPSDSETVTPEPAQVNTGPVDIVWLPAAEKELKKIPFFVRGKAKRNTETFASERGVQEISVDTLYEAKAHYAR